MNIRMDTPPVKNLEGVRSAVMGYERDWKGDISINRRLDRSLVSFQSNKKVPFHRLFKYKEGFSSNLVEYLMGFLKIEGPVLDPFSGTGTTGITTARMGISSFGIELLPVGHIVSQAKAVMLNGLGEETVSTISRWKSEKPWKNITNPKKLTVLRITTGAYPENEEREIEKFFSACSQEKAQARLMLTFAGLSVLESVSYTRKDGQCLRWDWRSGRTSGKPFEKGDILLFDEAVVSKMEDILVDALNLNGGLFNSETEIVNPQFILGSALEILPVLRRESFGSVITSPPYCNRYDYTRTYALELAALGHTEEDMRRLRKTMLSCTVENQHKNLLSINPEWEDILICVRNHRTLQMILKYLYGLKKKGGLNNNGIPRMVEGYFSELACVIFECSRLLKAGGTVVMVNDNVQYAGIAIPIDMILSDLAESCGFSIDRIMVLPVKKGNSSQQMGEHGRNPLRKCVYVWRKHNS